MKKTFLLLFLIHLSFTAKLKKGFFSDLLNAATNVIFGESETTTKETKTRVRQEIQEIDEKQSPHDVSQKFQEIMQQNTDVNPQKIQEVAQQIQEALEPSPEQKQINQVQEHTNLVIEKIDALIANNPDCKELLDIKESALHIKKKIDHVEDKYNEMSEIEVEEEPETEAMIAEAVVEELEDRGEKLPPNTKEIIQQYIEEGKRKRANFWDALDTGVGYILGMNDKEDFNNVLNDYKQGVIQRYQDKKQQAQEKYQEAREKYQKEKEQAIRKFQEQNARRQEQNKRKEQQRKKEAFNLYQEGRNSIRNFFGF